MGGMLIVVEGLDGTGKHTQSELLVKYLERKGIEVICYAYPDYASEYGNILSKFLQGKTKKSVEELFLTYLTDMVKDRESLEKDLAEGKTVVVDRYFHSTVAYQSAGGFNYEKAKLLQSIVALPKPDLVIYFEIPVAVSMARKERQRQLENGEQDRFEKSNIFQENAALFYSKMISESFGTKQWMVISADGSVDEVHEKVISCIAPLMSKAYEEASARRAVLSIPISDKKADWDLNGLS